MMATELSQKHYPQRTVKSKSRGRARGTRKPKVRIPRVHPGILTDEGYHVDLSRGEREAALRMAVERHGSGAVIHALNNLVVWHRNKGRDIRATAKVDENFVRSLGR